MSIRFRNFLIPLVFCTNIGCTTPKDTASVRGFDLEESISLDVQNLDSERSVMVLEWSFDFSTDLMISKTMSLDFSGSSVLSNGTLLVYGAETPWTDNLPTSDDPMFTEPINIGEDVSIDLRNFDYEQTSIYTAYEITNGATISGEATATLNVTHNTGDPEEFGELAFTIDVL